MQEGKKIVEMMLRYGVLAQPDALLWMWSNVYRVSQLLEFFKEQVFSLFQTIEVTTCGRKGAKTPSIRGMKKAGL